MGEKSTEFAAEYCYTIGTFFRNTHFCLGIWDTRPHHAQIIAHHHAQFQEISTRSYWDMGPDRWTARHTHTITRFTITGIQLRTWRHPRKFRGTHWPWRWSGGGTYSWQPNSRSIIIFLIPGKKSRIICIEIIYFYMLILKHANAGKQWNNWCGYSKLVFFKVH